METTSNINTKNFLEESHFFNKGSVSSLQIDLYQLNKDYLFKGFDNAFRQLSTNLYSTINSAFSSFTDDFNKRIDHQRELYENAEKKINEDLQNIKKKAKEIKKYEKVLRKDVNIKILSFYELKRKARFFRVLSIASIKKKMKKIVVF